MEVLRELMKKPSQAESLSIGFFVAAVLYTIYRGTAHTVLLGIGFALIVLGALPRQPTLAFLVGASAIFLAQTGSRYEGFADGSAEPTLVENPDAALASDEELRDDEEEEEARAEAESVDTLIHGTNELTQKQEMASLGMKKEKAGFQQLGKKMTEGFSKNKVMLPDNADRKEPLVLGKAYKLPNEKDDKGFHLDAGTTFLNAYKALKPDQIAAMTKDTQELLATQKSLIGMLDSFGPLMKDMSKITGFLGPAGPAGTDGN